jgi:long-subunit fatty acid transport protein
LRRLLIIALLLLSGVAQANPFYIARYDGLRSDATYTGAYALYWNPAALARPGWDVAVDGTFIGRQATYNRDATLNNIPAAEQSSNAGLAREHSASVVPSLMARYGHAFGPIDLGFGLGGFVDIAGSAHWDHNKNAPPMYPGAIDGTQRWSTISTSFTVYTVAAALALRYRKIGLSLGITPMLDIVQFATTVAANLDGTDDLTDSNNQLKEGRAYVHGSTIAGRFILGARWESPTGRWAGGITWHRGVDYHVKGTLDAVFGIAPPTSAPATVSLPIADDIMFAASLGVHRRFTLRPSIEWGLWHELHENLVSSSSSGAALLTTVRNFHDTIAGRVRGDLTVHNRVQLQAGLGFERGATPASTQAPGLGENNNLEAGAGVYAALSHNVNLSLGFIMQYFLPRTVTDSIQKPTENGRYTDQREFVSLHLEVHGWRPYFLGAK